ncbi:MAG: bacillithiol system redox-active protein YtxJ [Saprospiraceae bacterium]|nr:bacillithiol system redox-active protein YtxJ [Saprospiraceae bacterium]
MIQWKNLDSEQQLESIIEDSHNAPQIIFKHSTTCPISGMAKRRLEGNWSSEINPYYLDLLAYRSVSNAIETQLAVTHQSPQVIILHKGKAIYDESHLDISSSELENSLQQI